MLWLNNYLIYIRTRQQCRKTKNSLGWTVNLVYFWTWQKYIHMLFEWFFSFYKIETDLESVWPVCTFVCCRILSLFSDSFRTEESDDIHAALALMYGYAAKYAPSTVIEARINALVVGYLFSLLLSWCLHKYLSFVVLLYFRSDTNEPKRVWLEP